MKKEFLCVLVVFRSQLFELKECGLEIEDKGGIIYFVFKFLDSFLEF